MIARRKYWQKARQIYLLVVLLAGILSACRSTPPQENIANVWSTASLTAESAILPAMPVTQVGAITETTLTLDACLLGSWAVSDFQQSLAESYSHVQSPLALQGITGETLYIFRPDGSLEIRFDNLVTTLAGIIDGKDILARNLMIGTATALYRLNIETREIVFSNFGGDGIQFATEINGQVLAQGDFPAWRAFSANLTGASPTVPSTGPTRVVEESHASLRCSGDEMNLQALEPVPGPEVKLLRIK